MVCSPTLPVRSRVLARRRPPEEAPLHPTPSARDAGPRVRGDGPRVKVRVPRDTSHLDRIRAAVVDLARRGDFRRDEVAQIEMAVDEACANAILHADPGRDLVEVVAELVGPSIRVVIRDFGAPWELADPTLADYHDRRGTGGLGSYVIREFMDEVRVRRRPEGANELILVRRRPGRPSTAASRPTGP